MTIALAEGRDPCRPKAAVDGGTFEDIAKSFHAARKSSWVSASADRIWSRLNDGVFPSIGDKRSFDIAPMEVLAQLRKIEGCSAIEMAKRVRQTISNVSAFAIAEGEAKYDPAASLTAAVKRAPLVRHRAKLAEADLGDFFARLRTSDEPQ